MRTIEEIKETICADFMRNESVAELFGFTPGDSFTSHFSKVSVIGILFYIFAVAAWALEKLFDTYKGEVDTRIEEIIPHRPRWYRDKVLAFMKGKTLIADTDRYDTEGMTEDAIAAARVVKHAVAVIGYTPKAADMAQKIEEKANEMLKEGYTLVSFSVTAAASAILVFKK